MACYPTSSSTASETGSPSDETLRSGNKSALPSPPTITKEALLEAAKGTVADRGLNYGTPEDNFGRIARLWNIHLTNRHNGPLTPADVAQMMVLMKVARLENTPAHLDSWTDIAGYAACGANITCKDPTPIPSVPDRELKTVNGIEYEWRGKMQGWIATGNHAPNLTNTPPRGTPERNQS